MNLVINFFKKKYFLVFSLFLISCSTIKSNLPVKKNHEKLENFSSIVLLWKNKILTVCGYDGEKKKICRGTESLGLSALEVKSILAAAHYSSGAFNAVMKQRILNYKKPDPGNSETVSLALNRFKELVSAGNFTYATELKKSAEDFNSQVDQFIDYIFNLSQFELIASAEHTSHLWPILYSLLNPEKFEDSFVDINPGLYTRGSPPYEKHRRADEQQFPVKITSSFQIQRTPVTQLQYFKIMGYNPSFFSLSTYCKESYSVLLSTRLCPDFPVENVSWLDVQIFLKRLNFLSSEHQYSLPTENEREYFSRADTTSAFSFGDSENAIDDYGFWLGNSNKQTHRVGSKNPNPWGIFDVHGNVWELCANEYDFEPLKSKAKAYSMRGGSWGSLGPSALRSARRHNVPADFRGYMIGFRLKRIPK